MLTKQDLHDLDERLLLFSSATQCIHSWIENFRSTQRPIVLPIKLQEFDPDPTGTHEMSDQRRLDSAFEQYTISLDTKIRNFLKD